MSSLDEILVKLKALDDDMAPEQFDPAEIIGDLRGKVDALKWRIDDWESQAQAIFEKWLTPLTQKKQSLERKAERLRDYIVQQMKIHEFETLPGEAFRIDLRKTAKVVVPDATPQLARDYPELIRESHSYAWNKQLVADKLKEGGKIPGCMVEENHHVRFFTKK